MPPNTVNNSTDNVPVRRKGQQRNDQPRNEQQPKEDQQVNEEIAAQSTEPQKGLHTDIRVTAALAFATFLVVILSPATLKQLAHLKRSYYRTPVDPFADSRPVDPFADSRPVASKAAPQTGSVIDPDTGVEYEYHQFMATVEQHFPNIR